MKANTWRWAVATMACATAGFVGAVGCSSSSSSGGGASDGGDDASYYGPPPSDGSADGEGSVGDGGPDAPTCIVPASSTFSQGVPGGGEAGCAPQVPNGQCMDGQYRLKCSAPDPSTLPQPTDTSCNFLPSSSTVAFYCCSCQGAAGSGDN